MSFYPKAAEAPLAEYGPKGVSLENHPAWQSRTMGRCMEWGQKRRILFTPCLILHITLYDVIAQLKKSKRLVSFLAAKGSKKRKAKWEELSLF